MPKTDIACLQCTSLLFAGLGVMLVVVVGIGWRCTPIGHEPCHLLFNLGEHSLYEYGRRHRNGRRPRDRNQWFGGTVRVAIDISVIYYYTCTEVK